jgi:small subunit ribosomal protein S13
MSSTEGRHIVRVAGHDLDGGKKLIPALADIKGVGYNLAQAVVTLLRLDPKQRLAQLGEEEIKAIEEALKDPTRLGIPTHYLNRRKDLATGIDMHLIGSDLTFTIKSDIDLEKRIKSWRGIRHALGLKVRGQRTRTTGRKGRTVGVRKRAK